MGSNGSFLWNVEHSLCVLQFYGHILFAVTHVINLLKWKCQCLLYSCLQPQDET